MFTTMHRYCFAFALSSLVFHAPVRAQTNVLFIFDASGSMKKQAGGESRISAAKKAMKVALDGTPGGVRLGLLMYGHRRAKDCSDIELVSPIGADDAATINDTVQRVSPRGETPIAAALQRAAKSFQAFKGQQNSIVLVTDGIEECHGDPCAAARAIKEAGLDLKVHVVGYMLKARERQAIQCITATTGGRYFDASNPKTLVTALSQVRKEVEKAAPPAPTPAPTPEPRVVEGTPASPSASPEAPGTKLVAYFSKGGKEYDRTLDWWIYEDKKDLEGKRPEVAKAYHGNNGYIFRNLHAGKYVLHVELYGESIEREFPLEVKEGEIAIHEVVLDVAKVRLDAHYTAGGQVWDFGNLRWQFYDPKVGLDGKRTQIRDVYNVASGFVTVMPAGKFQVECSALGTDCVKREAELTVTAGEEQVFDIPLNGARVKLDAVMADGQPTVTDKMTWDFESTTASLDGKHARLTEYYNAAMPHVIALPAGEWNAVYRLTSARHVTGQKPIKVVGGQEQIFKVTLGAGVADVRVMQKDQLAEKVTWTIVTPGATPEKDAKVTDLYNGAAKQMVPLMAGTYRIDAHLQADGKQKGTASFTIKAGEAVIVNVPLSQ